MAARVGEWFRAFSDRTRLRILHLLRGGSEVCVGDLVAVLGAPQATVSRHLAYLRRAGLVRVRTDGPWKHYSLLPPNSRIHAGLLTCLEACAKEVRALATDTKRKQRLESCCVITGSGRGRAKWSKQAAAKRVALPQTRRAARVAPGRRFV